MDLRPHHVGIVVSDLVASKAFYSALGFAQDTEHVSDDKTISFMRLGALQIELFAYRKAMPTAPAGPALGFKHLALETNDIDGVYRELLAAGIIAAEITIRELPAGWRLLFFPDPDGVEIEIKQA